MTGKISPGIASEGPSVQIGELISVSGASKSEASVLLLRHREYVLRTICSEYGVTFEQVRGGKRYQDIHVARMRCAVTLIRAMGYSLPRAGQVLGGRHHTTVLQMRRTMDQSEPGSRQRLPIILWIHGHDMSVTL